MTRLYQAGPMRGREHYNFNEFERGKNYLQWLGHEVISPHDLDILHGNVYYHAKAWLTARGRIREFLWVELTPEFNMERALKMDVSALAQCDAISLLPGWEDSEGCAVERAVAELLKMPIHYHDPYRYFSMSDPREVVHYSCRT